MKNILYPIILSFLLIFISPISVYACSSDYSCRYGQKCVKAPYKSKGVCMDVVDRYGIKKYKQPSSNSIGPNLGREQCRFNTDCSIGFKCDRTYKVCVKKRY